MQFGNRYLVMEYKEYESNGDLSYFYEFLDRY